MHRRCVLSGGGLAGTQCAAAAALHARPCDRQLMVKHPEAMMSEPQQLHQLP